MVRAPGRAAVSAVSRSSRGPDDNFDAGERLRGYRDALARFAPTIATQVLAGDFTEESGYPRRRAICSRTS